MYFVQRTAVLQKLRRLKARPIALCPGVLRAITSATSCSSCPLSGQAAFDGTALVQSELFCVGFNVDYFEYFTSDTDENSNVKPPL